MAANDLSAKMVTKEDHVSIPIPSPTPEHKPEDDGWWEVPFSWYYGVFLTTLILVILFTSVIMLSSMDVKNLEGMSTPMFLYLAGATLTASYLASTLHCILPRFAYCLLVLNSSLLADFVLVVLAIFGHWVLIAAFVIELSYMLYLACAISLQKDKLRCSSPKTPETTPEDDGDVCGVRFHWYLGLFTATLVMAVSLKLANLGDGMVPEFWGLAGAALTVSYSAATVHCILPRLAFYLWILNIVLELAVVVFLVVILLIMKQYIFFYVTGVILGLSALTYVYVLTCFISVEREKLRRERRESSKII